MKVFTYLLVLILLSACSSGRYYKTNEQHESSYQHINREAATLIHGIGSSCDMLEPKRVGGETNTVFVHPGLLLLNLDWDQSLAVESAKMLIKNGYARDFMQLRDRNPSKVGEQMLKNPSTRFIGLHYSMGGQPQLLAATLESVAQAKLASGKDLMYSPILVDPFGIEEINTLLDLNAAHLGQIFIVLSGENSFFRPNISGVREDILRHPKVHLIYAEDIGENWSHFDALSSAITDDTPSRFRDVFFLIAHTIVEGRASADFEEQFALLKLKYAIEDSRPIRSSWLRLARELACTKESNRVNTTKR